MRLIAADVFAALVAFVCFYLFQVVAAHYATLPAYGYSGAWDFWVYFPLAMGTGLLILLIAFTFLRREPGMIALIAGFALVALLPYGMMIGGGV